ncbi:hypothetical protein ACWD01_29175 [Streptomyces sp. NPDC002835]
MTHEFDMVRSLAAGVEDRRAATGSMSVPAQRRRSTACGPRWTATG